MMQLSLLEQNHVFVSNEATDTQRHAAARALPKTSTKRGRILRAILDSGANGLTDEEMQDLLAMGHNTQTPRRRELALAGYVKDSGKRRKTSTGSSAIVWIGGPNVG